MTRRKTDAEFKKEVYDLVGDEYTFLDTYVNARTKLKVKHNKCNNIYKVMSNNFINGERCPYCNGNAKKTDTQFQHEVHNLVGDEYTFLDTYVNANTKIRVKHNKCGSIYEVRPTDFLNGNRCPFCSDKAKRTDDEFKQEVYNLVGNEYTFLDTYINDKVKLRVKHNKCNNIYKVMPNNFLTKGSRCPFCNSPKGELIISKILNKLSIPYEPQKTFDDLKDKDCLSYDFYIPDQSILIEYQGLQHYEPVDYFGGYATFKKQQRHDKLKAEYAKLHNYSLISIPYTEDTSFKIKKYLIKHGLKNI